MLSLSFVDSSVRHEGDPAGGPERPRRPSGEDTVDPWPSVCSCSPSSSFPGSWDRPTAAICCCSELDGEPEWVVVLGTLGAGRAPAERGSLGRNARAALARRRPAPASPEPATVATSRATIIDPISLAAEHQARAWLSEIDAEREVDSAVAVLNRVLHAYRIAAANPYLYEVSARQALVIRAGFGEGEQVADGNWLHARELPAQGGGGSLLRRARRARDAALRPQERLAELLGARQRPLVCEELALRARLDLDQGRPGAMPRSSFKPRWCAALSEAARGGPRGPRARIDALAKLRDGVARRAAAAAGAAPNEEP